MTNRHVAIHEAGHFVVARFLNLRVREIWIDGEHGAAMVTHHPATARFTRPQVSLAGPLAEGRLLDAEPTIDHPEAAKAWEATRQASHGMAVAHADKSLTDRVNQILDRDWPLVEMVADALQERGRLTEREIRNIYREYREG
jgi:hypothetical protein